MLNSCPNCNATLAPGAHCPACDAPKDDPAALESVGDERDFFDRVNPLWGVVAIAFICALT